MRHRDVLRSTPVAKPVIGLAKPIRIERSYAPDRVATLAALRVVLGLPRALPRSDQEVA